MKVSGELTQDLGAFSDFNRDAVNSIGDSNFRVKVASTAKLLVENFRFYSKARKSQKNTTYTVKRALWPVEALGNWPTGHKECLEGKISCKRSTQHRQYAPSEL